MILFVRHGLLAIGAEPVADYFDIGRKLGGAYPHRDTAHQPSLCSSRFDHLTIPLTRYHGERPIRANKGTDGGCGTKGGEGSFRSGGEDWARGGRPLMPVP
jgi:hypothetical protein